MISLWVFYVFVTVCIGFMRTEKRNVKVIDDDFYNKMLEFKAKNVTKMNRNYRNANKKYGESNILTGIMLMEKISLNM